MAEIEMPKEIKTLIARCEVGETSFSNDDMSAALKFAEMLWRRLTRMAEHYDRMSGNFTPNDIRGPMMSDAAKDMRHVLRDTAKDCESFTNA